MQEAAYAPEMLTDDAFLGGRLHILQPRDGLRAGIDAVMLAAALPIDNAAAGRLADLGSGSGVVGLCAQTRAPSLRLLGLESAAPLVELARRNAVRNDRQSRARFEVADVCALADTMTSCNLQPNMFDHVCANPPWFAPDKVRRSPTPLKDGANVMASADLDRWVRFMTHVTRAHGTATMIHVASALPQLLAAFDGRFGALRACPIFPRTGAPASRVIVQGRKESRTPFAMLPGLVLHEADGAFTPQAKAILRDAAPLSLD